ncbi:hypothetical protein FQ707_10500 [Bacteroidaceae bacterium HV4-6-C5C]|nr:hypothetical protein FQ707_10500 [Bacteroidaceae bacterium HV4-6-C5C]
MKKREYILYLFGGLLLIALFTSICSPNKFFLLNGGSLLYVTLCLLPINISLILMINGIRKNLLSTVISWREGNKGGFEFYMNIVPEAKCLESTGFNYTKKMNNLERDTTFCGRVMCITMRKGVFVIV